MLKDESRVAAIVRDYRGAEISAPDRALFDYAVKLTREPWAMTRKDIEKLRAAGFSDSAILDANLVSAYYAFVNRLADGLGVELEARWGAKSKDR